MQSNHKERRNPGADHRQEEDRLILTGLTNLPACPNVISFLNSCVCCKDAHCCRTACNVGKMNCRGEQKQQQPRCFVHHRMQSDEGFPVNKACHDIADFDGGNCNNPYSKPLWHGNDRKQFYKGYGCKQSISSGVKFCAEYTGTACFSGNGSIHHITEAAQNVKEIKLHG